MKNYYQILRISRQAGETEIKSAYRRLAVLFHPDKNRSAEASALFQEINEAHEVLADTQKRFQYDQMLDGVAQVFVDTPPAGQQWHRDPAYRRKQQAGYRPPKPQPSETLLMMLHLLKYMRLVSFIGIGYCSFMVVDYMLPFHVSKEKALPEGNQKISWQYHHEPNLLVTDKGSQIPIPFDGVDFFPTGSQVEIVSSRILHVLVRVEAENNRYTISSLASVYQNMVWAPLLLLILSMVGLRVKTGIEFRFNILISICIVFGFNLIFLLFSVV